MKSVTQSSKLGRLSRTKNRKKIAHTSRNWKKKDPIFRERIANKLTNTITKLNLVYRLKTLVQIMQSNLNFNKEVQIRIPRRI